MSEPNIWDPEHKYDGESSPFLVKEGLLHEFRPARALESLVDDSRSGVERLVILAGLTAWMIAPSGTGKPRERSVKKLSVTEFIYQSMMVQAAEDLDEVFYSARRYQALSKNWSTQELLSQRELLTHDFNMFFALGGFEAMLNHASLPQFMTHLKNQSVPVSCVRDVVDALRAAEKAGGRPAKQQLFQRASEAAKLRYESTADNAGVDPSKQSRKRQGAGYTASNIRRHWDEMAPAAPLLYAAGEIDNGNFLLKVLRSNTLRPFELSHWDYPSSGFPWARQWIKRANEIAKRLLDVGLIKAWPPANVFRTR